MKKLFLLPLLVLIIPAAFADIALQADRGVYNLGNKIKASASLLQDSDFEGIFRLSISCPESNLQYFTTPVSLEANSRTALNVPDLTASPQMLGKCVLAGDLMTGNNLPIDHGISENFEITHNLEVLPVNEKITALPGSEIIITGIVNEAYGNNVISASLKASLDSGSYESEITRGKYSLDIQISPGIKSGSHNLDILAYDSKNNIGSATVKLEIEPIPTYIKLVSGQNTINPGAKIEITASVYDQADDLINTAIELEMANPSGENLFSRSIASGEKVNYEFSSYAEPGAYTLTSRHQNLAATSSINVSPVRDVSIKYENQSVFVENTGNVPFIDELTFILQNELDRFTITKKISIGPGNLFFVDLSKEVPYGIYNVLMPLKGAVGAIGNSLNNSVFAGASGKNDMLANEVQIDDHRPIYKKIASGFGSISGNLVGADGVLTKNPLVAPAILAAILLLIFFRYGRKPVMGIIKRKKPIKEEKKE